MVPPPLVVVVEPLVVVEVEPLVVVVVDVVDVLPPQVKVADPEPIQWVYQELLLTDTEALPVPLLHDSTATT